MSPEEVWPTTPVAQCRHPHLALNEPLCLPSLRQSRAGMAGPELVAVWPRSADALGEVSHPGAMVGVRGRQCLVGWARGSAAAWEVCAAAQTPFLHRQAFPLLPAVRLALLCFTPLISTNFVLKFIWPHKRVYIFLDPLAAFKRLDEHLCCGTCSTKLSGAVGSVFGLLPAALGQCWASGLPNLLGFLSLRLDFNGFYTERLEHMSAERSQKAAPLLPRLAVPAQWSPAVAPFSHPPPLLHQQRTGHSLTSN